MRILHAISSVNPAGGGPIEGVKQLSAVARSKGHNIEIVSLDAPNAPFLASCPTPVYPLGPSSLRYRFSKRIVPWLRENAGRYDVVIVNGIWQYHSFGVWRALRGSSTPYVVFTHGMLDPWFKRTYPLKHAKKWLYWPWGEYRVLRDAAAVLFTCEEERILAGRSFWLYKANEVVVNYGTARPRGEPCSQISTLFDRFPHLRGKRLALFMGRIHPKKGLDLVIEAFARVLSQDPVWHLVIAGPDEVSLRARLELRARRLNISDRITWTAMLSGDFKWGALHASEVFLLTSHQENFGIAVAEALACGLPVLISNKVNIWREVKNDGAGLVAEDDLQGACELLRSWVATSDEEKSVMAKRAQNCFNKRFEIQQSSRSLLSILGRIAAV